MGFLVYLNVTPEIHLSKKNQYGEKVMDRSYQDPVVYDKINFIIVQVNYTGSSLKKTKLIKYPHFKIRYNICSSIMQKPVILI